MKVSLVVADAVTKEDRLMQPAEALAEIRRLGVCTPNEAAAIVRAARDGRYRRTKGRTSPPGPSHPNETA